MTVLYLWDGNQPVGPYSLEQIRGMLKTGVITLEFPSADNDKGPWVPLRECPEFSAAGGGTATEDHFTRWVDTAVRRITVAFADGDWWRRYLAGLVRWGARGLPVCGAIWFLFSLAESLQVEHIFPAFVGAMVLALTVSGYYFTVKFGAANLSLLHAERVELGSSAMPASLALVSLLIIIVAGAGALITTVVAAKWSGELAIIFILAGLVLVIMCYHHAGLCAHCEPTLLVGTAPRRLSFGETYVGLVQFGMRLGLALGMVGLAYGAAATALWLTGSGIVGLVHGRQPAAGNEEFFQQVLLSTTLHTWPLLALSALPLILYFSHVIPVMLFVDVPAAIFRIARNTDHAAVDDDSTV